MNSMNGFFTEPKSNTSLSAVMGEEKSSHLGQKNHLSPFNMYP